MSSEQNNKKRWYQSRKLSNHVTADASNAVIDPDLSN